MSNNDDERYNNNGRSTPAPIPIYLPRISLGNLLTIIAGVFFAGGLLWTASAWKSGVDANFAAEDLRMGNIEKHLDWIDQKLPGPVAPKASILSR